MNLFSITSLIIFASSIGFGLSVYATDRKSKVNQKWFIFSGLLAMWGLGIFGVTWSDNAQLAVFWQYILDVSAIFMSVAYFAFASELVKASNRNWRIFSYIMAIVLAIFSFTPYFKLGVALRYNFYWIVPGQLYFVFPIFFLIIVVVSLVLYILAYIKSKDRIFKAQIRNIFLASVVGFGGGMTNFLPQITNTYPFGNYFVLLYLFFMSYGVLRYKLLSAKMISAQLFAGATFLVFLFSFLQADTIENKAISLLLLILVGVFSVLIVKGVYKEVSQREKIELLATNLQTANENQTNLIHIMNHQIKGKLGDARNVFAELLTTDYGVVPDTARPIIEKGLEATEAGVDYVQSVLKGYSAENGTLDYKMKDMDLKAMIKSVTDKKKEKAEKKGLTFEVNLADGEFMVHGDEMQLGEALGNLINNAIAFTPSGSIHIWLTKKGNNALVAVQDTGVGISEEDKPRLWKSGGHGKDSIKVNVESTGYGLSFVKGVIEKHGGRTWGESDGPGKGSSFFMELLVLGRV